MNAFHQAFNEKHNVFDISISTVMSSFNFYALCQICGKHIAFQTFGVLIEHYCLCNNSLNEINEEIQVDLRQNNIPVNIQLKDRNCFADSQIKKIDNLLSKGNLQTGSKKLYKQSLKRTILNQKMIDVDSLDQRQIISIIKHNCNTSNDLNAILRLRTSMHIAKQSEFTQIVREKQKLIKESQVHRPHQYGMQHQSKNFLMSCAQFKEACSHFLAARISELAQITFKMIIDGTIKYIPKKQQKMGQKAERKFILNTSVIQQTEKFISRNSISLDSTLNVGLNKNIIHSKSFHKTLDFATQFILENQNQSYTEEFQDFLKRFSYHDLRYTKLQELQSCGMDKKIIQQFVKHQSIKTTNIYLQEQQDFNCIDFNETKGEKNLNQGKTSEMLILNFQGTSDRY